MEIISETHLNYRLYVNTYLYKINASSPLFCNLEFLSKPIECISIQTNSDQVSKPRGWMVPNFPPSFRA